MPVLDDGVIEPDETFTVVLSNPWGATLVRDEATGVIKDDDLPVVSISTGSDSAAEGEDVRFDLVRSVNLKGRAARNGAGECDRNVSFGNTAQHGDLRTWRVDGDTADGDDRRRPGRSGRHGGGASDRER